ncbi:hypothetical protein KQX54_003561 [Cotesia glomerata]|uniref:FH2 domain-containing protein n=1 Tax=Cotesia glomerata TaxID=32391 RepID=A0AAV7IEK8_COTGL|nr:hypothetical protein KQX54_003561 [Cotesia glomerata]
MRFNSPNEYIQYLAQGARSENDIYSCVQLLTKALGKNPLSWDHEFGFNGLNQLSSTKDFENKETLMYYLVKTIEKNFPECLSFAEELSHVNKASRMSLENIKETLADINRRIKILEQDLANWNVPPSEFDRFVEVISPFAKETRAFFEVLRNMLEKMDALYTNLSEFFTFDKKKYAIEEFFGDIKKFVDDCGMFVVFVQAQVEIKRIRERNKHKRLRESGKQAATTESKRLVLEKKAPETKTGIMDSLLEQLQAETAFDLP